MNDRFRFRAFYHNPYEEDDCDNKKMFYDAENTYDYLNGVPASSFGDIIDSDFWTVEQCTGLKDKNGKLIYEGDIIYPGYEIKWSSLGYVLPNGNNLSLYNGSCEVIGNIHEKESK